MALKRVKCQTLTLFYYYFPKKSRGFLIFNGKFINIFLQSAKNRSKTTTFLDPRRHLLADALLNDAKLNISAENLDENRNNRREKVIVIKKRLWRDTMLVLVSRALTSMLVPALLSCGAYFFIYLRGFFVFNPIKSIKLFASGGKKALGELSVSLAGALGVGNIIGVAVAISLGGAGGIFWMWLSAAVSMILKYCEIVLSLKYRIPNGTEYFGGPMYYMRDGVKGNLGKVLAVCFAGLGVISSASLGNLVQSSAVVRTMEQIGVAPVVTAVVMCVLCAAVVFGGYSGVSKFTSIAVPLMSALYIFVSLRAMFLCRENIPSAFGQIFSGAFTPTSAAGGIFGFLLSSTVRQGTAKGAFSHEAGGGTAPMAHAQATPKTPAAQGMIGIFEVFFDTFVMCSMTALVILTSGVATDGVFGAELVVCAFEVTCGSAAKYIISFSVGIFAFSTIVCWSYYGRMCLSFFSRNKTVEKVFLAVYCASIISGAFISEGNVWHLSDVSVSLMTVINLAAVVWLRKDIKKETDAVFRAR